MMRQNIYLATAILVLIAGCGDTSTPQSDQSAAMSIPDDVTYTIIDENIVSGSKRSLDIRLNHKVREDELTAIAMKLKSADPNTYDRTFIGYYLPDMQVNAGYWATTHFNPDLEVRIQGLTIEQEEALRQQHTFNVALNDPLFLTIEQEEALRQQPADQLNGG